MSLPGRRGLRGAGGLRAAWERQQQAAQLAAVASRIPSLASCKPALFAAQLRPVLAALQQASQAAEADNQEPDAEGTSVQEQAGRVPLGGAHSAQVLAAAAGHVRRLIAVDGHAGANSCLLSCLLLWLAGEGDGELLAAPLFWALLGALGWQALLLEALPLLTASQRRQAEAGLLAAAAAAAADDGSSSAGTWGLLACVWGVLEALAGGTQRQLERYSSALDGSSSSSSTGDRTAREALVASMALLQQLLLVCPRAAGLPPAAAALRALQQAGDASMAQLLRALQQEERREEQQPVFQQLCQLRARLMLALASALSPNDGSAYNGAPGTGGPQLLRFRTVQDPAGKLSPAADAWHAVLRMPSKPALAAATTASVLPGFLPSRLEFLAACITTRCYVHAVSADGIGGSGVGSGGSSRTDQLGLQTSIPALPGVRFNAPAVLRTSAALPHPRLGTQAPGSMAAAAEAAEADLASDPGCLGPVHLALGALQLAAQVPASSASDSALNSANGDDTRWRLLLDLAAAAAAQASGPAEQRQLLLLALHGQQPWQQALRAELAADVALQQRCGAALVAVANRLASDAGTSGGATVHGEARRRRTAAAVSALLPHALLCPAVVLDRLVRDAVVSQGGQVELLLDVLREMQPLALYCSPAGRQDARQPPPAQQQPLLLSLLASLLDSSGAQQAAAALDTPGSQQALLQLVAGLCGAAPQRSKAGAGAGTDGASGSEKGPLLSGESVLEHVVCPILQHLQHEYHSQQQQLLAGEVSAAEAAATVQRMLVPLQLADVLLAAGGTTNTAGRASSGAAAGHAAAVQQQQRFVALQPLLLGLLDFEQRRVDRSAAALVAGTEAFELASSVLRHVAGSGQSGASQSQPTAGRYFQSQLRQALQQPAAGLPQHQVLQRFRLAVLRLLAALLPCCTPAEGSEVLQQALPAAVQAALLPQAGDNGSAAAAAAAAAAGGQVNIVPGAHAAALEVSCRAVRALALHPEQAPLAGEQVACATAASSAPTSALRQVAVERMLQHLTQHCARLAATPARSDSSPLADSGAAVAPGQQACAAAVAPQQQVSRRLIPGDQQALGLRSFRELCKLGAAIQPTGYDCATLQAGLLQLARQLLTVAPQQQVTEGTTVAPPGAAAAGQQRQGVLPVERVRQQLAAAAQELLPAGPLQQVVLLASEAAAS